MLEHMTTEPRAVHPEIVGPSDIERVEDLDASPEELWDAVGTAAGLAAWLGDEVEVDLRPGGTGFVRDDGELRVVLVDEVEPGRRLGFTWWPWQDRAERSYVELEVLPRATGSRLVIRETRLAASASRGVLLSAPSTTAWRWCRIAA